MFLLPAAERTVPSMVIRDVLLDQPEEFLASQMENEAFMEMQLKDLVVFWTILLLKPSL